MTAAAPSAPRLTDARDALADLARMDRFLDAVSSSLTEGRLQRLVLSKPRPGGSAVAEQLQRVTAKPVLIKGERRLSLLFQHATRDVTKNPLPDEALALVRGWLGTAFSHGHCIAAMRPCN